MFPHNKAICRCGRPIQCNHKEWRHICKNFRKEKYLGVVCKVDTGRGLCGCARASPKRS